MENPHQGENPPIDKALLMYHFHDHEYQEDKEELIGTMSQIIHSIEYGAISLYGVKKQDDGKYTLAFANENHDDCYKQEDFTESEMLEIFNTEYMSKA